MPRIHTGFMDLIGAKPANLEERKSKLENRPITREGSKADESGHHFYG
jgi:hypothetical protein